MPGVPFSPLDSTTPSISVEELVKRLQQFAEAAEAAKKVDELTGQKDCVDPDKARLQERVRELELLLQKLPEFVIVSGAQLAPGTYRVVDGKLYKVVADE